MSRLTHLIRRFFRSLAARRPGVADQEFVAAHLDTLLSDLFWAQQVPDQVHAIRVARSVTAARPDRSDLVRAALLHDVGKRHSRLGTVMRSLATAFDALRLPVTDRMRSYLDHEAIGADELAATGAEPVVIDFARNHHAEPATTAPGDWEALTAADHE